MNTNNITEPNFSELIFPLFLYSFREFCYFVFWALLALFELSAVYTKTSTVTELSSVLASVIITNDRTGLLIFLCALHFEFPWPAECLRLQPVD